MRKLFSTFLLLFAFCFGLLAKNKVSDSPAPANELLWWFPADTETLMVANGPITITDKQPEKFMDLMPRMAYLLMEEGKKSGLNLKLKGQKILLSIEGCRKFRSPRSLGLPPYEGCHIYIFDKEFSTVRDSLMKSLEVSAKEVLKIGDFKVSVFEEKLDEDIWEFYLNSPKEDTLLLATDLGFITEVLTRVKVKQAIRALPDSLKEWKYIDTNAHYWAIRHYDINNAAKDPSSPASGNMSPVIDKQAIGIVSMFNPGKPFIVRYLSSNKDAVKIQTEFWTPDYWDPRIRDKKPIIRLLEPGVVEINYSPDNQTIMTLFLYFGVFGHAIHV